jgi:hypothetical protein
MIHLHGGGNTVTNMLALWRVHGGVDANGETLLTARGLLECGGNASAFPFMRIRKRRRCLRTPYQRA